MVDFITIWTIISTVFTIMWVALRIIAPYTPTKKDDKLVQIVAKLIKVFSIELKDSKLEIKIKTK